MLGEKRVNIKYLKDSYLCQKVKIQVSDQFDYVGNCHCSECRKFSGSAFATAADVDFDDFKNTEGEDFVTIYYKTDDTPTQKPTFHIFVSSKAL